MPDPAGAAMGRRTALLVLGGAVVAGCSSSASTGSTTSASSAPASSPTGSTTPSATGGPSAGVALPEVQRWHPSPADVSPACKLAAVRLVQERVGSATVAVEIIDAQYGGILTDLASVLVATRWWRLSRGRLVRGGRTFDVRLSRVSAGRWQVTDVHPSRPGPPARSVSKAARRVLASDRIDLPPAAHGDVAAGQVHDVVLETMLALSRTYRIGISVLRSGHPTYVFGTTRLSDHPQGLAFDTWRINGRAVVDPDTPEPLVTAYMRAAAGLGSDNVGGPYLLGAAPQYFSDDTHHDHVHAGFPG